MQFQDLIGTHHFGFGAVGGRQWAVGGMRAADGGAPAAPEELMPDGDSIEEIKEAKWRRERDWWGV